MEDRDSVPSQQVMIAVQRVIEPYLASLTGAAAAHPSSRGPVTMPTSSMEALEQRQMLSAVSLTDGVLEVEGLRDQANVISLVMATQNKLVVFLNGSTSAHEVGRVDSIRVTGGSQGDFISLAHNVEVGAEIDGGGGDNFIRGGAADDIIRVGNGNNYVDARDGNDIIISGNGQNTLHGGAGNDTIFSGKGDNIIDARPGENVIAGHTGNDRIAGREGPDYVFSDLTVDALLGNQTPPTQVAPTPPPQPKSPQPPKNPTPPKNEAPPKNPTPPAEPPQNPAPPAQPPSQNDGKAPKASLKLLDGVRMAGMAVHVDALDTKLRAGSPLTALYEWDFGDPNGQYNKLTGFNAAHVYDKPGTYTITLRVTNELGNQSVTTQKVTIQPDTRKTIYVSSAGNDKNSGRSPDQPIRTIERARLLLGDNTKLLFRRGDTFIVNDLNLPYRNVLVGAYGSGNRPILYGTSDNPGTGIIRMGTARSRSITIENLTFDSKYGVGPNGRADKIPVLGIWTRGQNLTIRNNEFRNVNDAVMASIGATGLLVQDNSAPLMTGIRAYFIWAEGQNHVYLGNSAANSTREHIVRAGSTGLERTLIAHNDFANIDRRPVDDDIAKTTLALQVVKHLYVTGNTLVGGPVGIGPLRHEASQWNATSESIVIENNTFRSGLEISPASHHVMVRNNMFARDGGSAIYVMASDPNRPELTLKDVRILNNTGKNNAQSGTFLRLAGRAPGTVTLAGNRFVSPNLMMGGGTTGHIYVEDDSLVSFASIRNNVWSVINGIRWVQGGVFYVGKQHGVQDRFLTPERWNAFPVVQQDYFENGGSASNGAPLSGSIAATAVQPLLGVFRDLYGTDRPNGDSLWSAGAVQLS